MRSVTWLMWQILTLTGWVFQTWIVAVLITSYCRELLALSFVSETRWEKTNLFVSRIWDSNYNLYFCMCIHCSFINASFLRLLIRRVGKWLGDCGKQEIRDPGAIFFLHLSFLNLHLFPFVRRKSSFLTWGWQRAPWGTLRLVPAMNPCRLSKQAAKHLTGCVLEPADVLRVLP